MHESGLGTSVHVVEILVKLKLVFGSYKRGALVRLVIDKKRRPERR